MDKNYLDRASEMGVDITNPGTVEALIQAIRYCEARFTLPPQSGTAYIQAMAAATGWTEDEIRLVRNSPMVKVATRIVGEAIAKQALDSDQRKRLLSMIHEDTMEWYRNISRLAKGKPDKGGKLPSDRDQIMAFQALMETRFVEGYEKLLLNPSEDGLEAPQIAHLRRQEQLKSGSVLILDATESVQPSSDPISSEALPPSENSPTEPLPAAPLPILSGELVDSPQDKGDAGL